MLAKIETLKCELEITGAFRDLAIEERNDARRWSAAWKRAAKAWKHLHGEWESLMSKQINDMRSQCDSLRQALDQAEGDNLNARQIARRLLRERDEAIRYLDTAHEVSRVFETELADATATIQHLESDRDALRRQVEELRAVVEQVEWVSMIWGTGRAKAEELTCPWCIKWRKDGHAPDCPRQKALGLEK